MNKTLKPASRRTPAETGAAVVARLRLNGRTRLQHQQKQKNRQKLMHAARALFARMSYSVVTVDDIATRAKVSRTTFYRHFNDKWAIAKSLLGEMTPTLHLLYERLATYDDPSEEALSDWLGSILDLLKTNRSLIRTMREADVIEPEADAETTATHDRLILALGTRIPAFRLASSGSRAGAETRVRAHLLMLQFDQFCYSVAVRNAFDEKLAIRVMAQQFRQFIETVSPPSKRR